jgi:hypothetical protein
MSRASERSAQMTPPTDELANVGGGISGQIRKRRQDGQIPRLIAQLGNNALAIVGVVISIAEFAGLLTSGQLKRFVKAYPYPICIALIFVLLALLVSLNYAQTVRRQRSQLQAAAQQPSTLRPSAHDVRLFGETLADLPLDGPVITWLRRVDAIALDPGNFPADVLTALERTVGRLRRRPVGFDDDLVARALADFIAAIEDYRVSLEGWTLVWQNPALAGATGGLPPVGFDPVTGDLADSQQRLLRAYDSFILTAHRRGMDVGPLDVSRTSDSADC